MGDYYDSFVSGQEQFLLNLFSVQSAEMAESANFALNLGKIGGRYGCL